MGHSTRTQTCMLPNVSSAGRITPSLLNLRSGLNFNFVTSSFLRAMQFIIIFLQDVLTGEPDLVKCAKKAYEGSLKKFHGWMVQGIFSVSSTCV